jgi:hypothetical protein
MRFGDWCGNVDSQQMQLKPLCKDFQALKLTSMMRFFRCAHNEVDALGVSLLSAAHIAAFDFFCPEIGEDQDALSFVRLTEKAVMIKPKNRNGIGRKRSQRAQKTDTCVYS